MPDESPADETPTENLTEGTSVGDDTRRAAQESPRRPTAAASAASRARRIGGARTAPASPTAAPAAPVDAAHGDEAPVPADKTGERIPAEPGPTEDTPTEAADKDRAVVEVPAWLRWVPAGVLSACAIAMIVLILIAAHSVWYAKPSSSSTRDRVLAAAKTCTAAANTYSYQTLKQDEAKGLACSTGAWSREYRTAIKTIVTPAATRLKASQSIQINNAGIETISSGGGQWTVVVFGQTKITQSGNKPRLDPFSAQVVMTDVGGKWLISKIKTIVNPSG